MANKKSTDISKIKLDQSTPSNSKTQMKGKTVRKTVMKDNSTKDKHIVWKSKFKIGIDKIDEQHKQWFKYAEAVHELSVKEKTDKELLIVVVPVAAPMVIVVPAPARLTVVAVVLKSVAVVWVVVRSPPLIATSSKKVMSPEMESARTMLPVVEPPIVKVSFLVV